MPTTALIAGGLGAAGSIGSALIGSSAADKASQQQADAQRQALAQQQSLYNQGLGQQSNYFQTAQNTLNPFISAGKSVLPTLQSLLTPGTSADTLSQMPGFQFQAQYGTKAATNALAARGQGSSAGPLATAISQYNNGLAGTTWQNTVNALQGYANMGTGAAGSLAGIAGSAGNADLGGGIQAGNSQAGTLGNIGTAQASGTLGSANALAGGLTGAASSGSNALLINSLLNRNGGGGIYGGAGPGSALMGGGSPTGYGTG